LLNLKLIETFDKNGSQAILLSYQDSLILAFRGTEPSSVKDIRSDAEGYKVTCPSGGYNHSGFSKAYAQIGDQIQDRLNQDDCKDKLLFITGHNLGGSLATVATKVLKHQGQIGACYTFGSPRVGDIEWIGNVKDSIYRIVNAADAVTMLPSGDATVWILEWLAKLIPQFGHAWGKPLSDHSIQIYRKKLERIAEIRNPE